MAAKMQQRPDVYKVGLLLNSEAIEQCRGPVEILRTIGIKERIDARHLGKGHGREPIALRPDIHLADTLFDHCPAQLVTQLNRPQPDHWMGLPTRSSAGKFGARRRHSLHE